MSSLQSLSLFLKHYYACEVCAYTRTHMLHHTSMHIIWKLEDSVIEFVLSTFAWIPEIYLRLPGLCVAFPNWATSQVLWIVWYHYAPMGKAHLSSPFTPLFFSFFFLSGSRIVLTIPSLLFYLLRGIPTIWYCICTIGDLISYMVLRTIFVLTAFYIDVILPFSVFVLTLLLWNFETWFHYNG